MPFKLSRGKEMSREQAGKGGSLCQDWDPPSHGANEVAPGRTRGAQRTLFCPSWLFSPSTPPRLSVLHCMNLVGSSGCMFGTGIRSCHTHLDLLSAEMGHVEGEGLGLLPGPLKGPQVEVVLGAIS